MAEQSPNSDDVVLEMPEPRYQRKTPDPDGCDICKDIYAHVDTLFRGAQGAAVQHARDNNEDVDKAVVDMFHHVIQGIIHYAFQEVLARESLLSSALR